MAMFSESCTVDKHYVCTYRPSNGIYHYQGYDMSKTMPSCMPVDIKIPNVEGWMQNIEIKYPYYNSSGITLQWALRPYKNAFVNPDFDNKPSGGFYTLGDVDKYCTYSTSVPDDLVILKGTVKFPAASDYAYSESVIIPANVVKPGNWYTIVYWGIPSGVGLTGTSSRDVIANANYYPGLVQFDNGSGFDKYIGYVDNGTGWDMVMPYIDNGSGWDLYT